MECGVQVEKNFDHVSPTCPKACKGSFNHPPGDCPWKGAELRHNHVTVKNAEKPR